MKKIILFSLSIIFNFNLIAQDYFQQEVNYQIEVTLDDKEHVLKGEVFIEYINNSPDALSEIHFHLWPNAYKNRETAFAKQQARLGSTKFYFADATKYGGIEKIDFLVKNKSLNWTLDKDHPDIAIVQLASPLTAGKTVEITIPFTEKIPSSFSRLGHVGESYQMTQWYPKTAVYDENGWQAMPYLDMGEFYSEFGRYEVNITLPENYVVGATGELRTDSEKDFLEKKIKETKDWLATYEVPLTKNSAQLRKDQRALDTFPASSERMKTIRYSAQNVHDFAWFADKRFRVIKDAVTLESGRKIDTYAMFTKVEENLWTNAAEYLNRSVKFYSDHVGEYPYPHATAVQSALSAGGGMEYPMITVIGLSGDAQTLDRVITHEVGHNWFYGILGTNERIHPWMDEGMNSYYENRYMREFYGDEALSLTHQGVPKFLANGTELDAEHAAYRFQVCNHRGQAPDLDSDHMTRINYGVGAYFKPAMSMRQMELAIGTEVYDRAMKAYFSKWTFKHPDPEDFRAIMQQETGKDLTWFFEGFMFSADRMDYKLVRFTENSDSYSVLIKNVGDVAAPFPLNGMKDDSIAVVTQWYEGFEGEQELTFPKGEYDAIMLDGEVHTLESKYSNNNSKLAGLFKKIEPLKLTLLGGVENQKRTYLGIMPVVAFNNYDKTLLGFGLHNYRIPERPFTYFLAPTYGLGSKELGGLGHLSYRFNLGKIKDNGTLSWLELGTNFQSFNQNYNVRYKEYLRYSKYGFYGKLRKENPTHNRRFEVEVKYSTVGNEDLEFGEVEINGEIVNQYIGTEILSDSYYEVSTSFENTRKINPYSYELSFENGTRQVFFDNMPYSIIKGEIKTAYTYENKKNINIRIFGGVLLSDFRDRNIPGYLSLTGQGYSEFNDYKYDEWYFGRNDNSGLFSQQISIRDGGFKNAFPAPFSTRNYNSNRLLLSLNLKADLPSAFPLNLPIKPYFDVAYVEQGRTDLNGDGTISDDEKPIFNDQFWWSGGFALEFGDEIFAIYFPVVNSKNISALYTENFGDKKYFNRVTFVLNLKKLNPRKLVDRLEF